MLLQEHDASKLISTPIDINLGSVKLKQNQIQFNGGYSLNFSEILSNVVDVKNKNYSIFYITEKARLSEYITQNQLKLTPETITTPIRSGNLFISIAPLSGSNPINYDYYYNLIMDKDPSISIDFKITFIDSEFCTIGYADDISDYLLIVDNNELYLEKSLHYSKAFSASGPQFFKYILNKDKIFLLKDTGSEILQIASSGNSLIGVSVNNMSVDAFRDNSFTISTNISLDVVNKVSTDYITYNNNNLSVNLPDSDTDLSNNFLVYRNLDRLTSMPASLIVLKNQMTDNDTLAKANNLSYYNGQHLTDLRNYTSIFNDIDSTADEGLDLNYITYNKSINILPGRNFFITEKVLTPFIQVNINDTTFVESGALPFTSPIYSDRVLRVDKLNDNTEKSYLCTWLSGSPYSGNSVWVDRYYYPDYITKKQALSTTQLFNTTYNSYLESLISSTAALSSSIIKKYVFDKTSDMVFTPDTSYIYDRFDFNTINFNDLNIYGSDIENYYTDINENGGFTLACTLVNNTNVDPNVVFSEFNGIGGGVTISYTNTKLNVSILLYNSRINDFEAVEVETLLRESIDNSIILNIDSSRGIVQLFVNGDLRFTDTISALSKILFGDFYAGSEHLINTTSFVSNVFLTTSPLPPEDIEILNIKDSNNYTYKFDINLPCGMRNITDSIAQIHSMTTNQKSKSNSINVHVSNTGITDETILKDIKTAIMSGINEITPVNTNINQINIQA